MYYTLKDVHIATVVLTIVGFMLRGYWMMTRPELLAHKLVKVVPHIIDTVLLLSGIALIVTLHIAVLEEGWLLAKFVALIAYVVLGAIALGRGKTMRSRVTAFVASLAVFAYIVGVALTKSVASFFVGL